MTARIDSAGRVYVGQASIGRVLDAKPHNVRWLAVDRAGRQSRHFTKAGATNHLVTQWEAR